MTLLNLKRTERRVRKMAAAGLRIAIVVPCYNVEKHIIEVFDSIPDYVRDVVLVDDASKDNTAAIIDQLAAGQRDTKRVRHVSCYAIHLPQNRGVGGAMVSGFNKVLEFKTDIIVKMDGDGQMDPKYLPLLIEPLASGKADYTKGNRLQSAFSLVEMPMIRRFGNAVLSFLTKISSGYWNVIDPNNGYIAIRREVLEILPMEILHPRYFFESSMLIALRLVRAVVLDIPMDARYRGERSNMRIRRVLIEFPWQLTLGFLRRLWLTKILFSLTIEAILSISGLLLVIIGFAYGFMKTFLAPGLDSGISVRVMLMTVLPVFLGFQMLMNALLLDIQSVPVIPLCDRITWDEERDIEDDHEECG